MVEIDLLRDGEPLPVVELPGRTDYRILVSRSQTRPTADLYAFNVPDLIPSLPIPLLPEDPEPQLNLKELLDKIYDNSGYSYFIDYAQDPVPALSTDEVLWVDQLLKEQQLRSPKCR